ncbi:MAG: hypothetical protein ABIP97_03745 [Chthoniobacterales bacterium]
MITRFLRFFAVVVIVATFAFWMFGGANTGPTKYPVPVKNGENTIIKVEGKFSPGIEFLVGNGVFAIILFGLSFIPGLINRKA